MPWLLLSALAGSNEKSARFFFLPLMACGGLAQVFYWLVWAAFCQLVSLYFAIHAGGYGWIYRVIAFGDCLLPLAYLSANEAAVDEAAPGKFTGALIYTLLTAVGFVVFSVWPQLLHPLILWVQLKLGE